MVPGTFVASYGSGLKLPKQDGRPWAAVWTRHWYKHIEVSPTKSDCIHTRINDITTTNKSKENNQHQPTTNKPTQGKLCHNRTIPLYQCHFPILNKKHGSMKISTVHDRKTNGPYYKNQVVPGTTWATRLVKSNNGLCVQSNCRCWLSLHAKAFVCDAGTVGPFSGCRGCPPILLMLVLMFSKREVPVLVLVSPLKFPAQNGRARARHKPSFCAGQGFAQKMGLGSVIL